MAGNTRNSRSKKVEEYKDDWEIVGWLSSTKNGKVYTVSEPQTAKGDSGDLIGFVRAESLERLVDGEINGVPIKRPPSES